MPSSSRLPVASQGVRFVIVGLIQLVLDWLGYVALTHAGLDTAWANPASRTFAMLFGFVLHGSYTFADDEGARLGWQRALRFLLSWGSLTLLGTVLLRMLAESRGLPVAWLAKPVVEAFLAVISYVLLRFWVYRK